jgi:hypothetical protein
MKWTSMFRRGLVTLLTVASFGCGTDNHSVSSLAGSTDPCTWSDLPSTTAPIITRSGAYSSSYEATNAFDANDSSMWISEVFQNPAWIGYEYTDSQRRVLSYNFKFINGTLTSRAPKDWTLQAWNGSTWVVIDTRTNQINWNGVEERSYTVARPGFYNRYRFNFTDDNDTRAGVVVISLGRITLNVDVGCSYDWSQLQKDWHRDSNLSTSTVDHYVPMAVPVPTARFVPAMKFKANNAYEKYMLSPDDRHYFAPGTYARSSDNKISTTVNDPRLGTLNETLRVLSVSSTSLRIAR